MDPIIADVAADPSPAPVAPAPVTDAPKRALADLTTDERRAWRKSGIIPDALAASSTATADGQPAATAATSDPASEPAHDDPDYKPKTAKRIKELLAEIERLKTAPPAPPARVAAAVSTPAPVASTLVKPDPETFTYGTADPDYLEALTDYKVEKKLETERLAASAADQKRQTDDAIAATNRSWTERRAAAEAKYADFAAVALQPFAPGFEIPSGSVIDAWILESEYGADVLYALMKNPAEIRRINSLKPHQQARELTLLEQKATAPLKTTTTAPDPGPVLGVRSGDPGSASARAIKKGDTAAYIREKNREEIAARKGH